MIFTYENFDSKYQKYINDLKLISSLSYLFSESHIPFIYYRAVEKIFCQSFNLIDLSRQDMSFDTQILLNDINYGIGLKTFILNSNQNEAFKTEKIAEFNKENVLKNNLKNTIQHIAFLRNNRINKDKIQCKIDKSIYHCIVRTFDEKENTPYLLLQEFLYNTIDLDTLVCTDKHFNPLSQQKMNCQIEDKSLYFKDQFNHYLFNRSKSTLFQKFKINKNNGQKIPVHIIKDPLKHLSHFFDHQKNDVSL